MRPHSLVWGNSDLRRFSIAFSDLYSLAHCHASPLPAQQAAAGMTTRERPDDLHAESPPRQPSAAELRRRRSAADSKKQSPHLLRPHLAQARQLTRRIRRLRREAQMAWATLEALDQAVVVLDRTLAVKFWTHKAWLIAARHFPQNPPGPKRLPEPLLRFAASALKHHGTPGAASVPPALSVRSADAVLTARLIPNLRAGAQFLLILEERLDNFAPRTERLTSIGLTHRQAEVLCWVGRGMTNVEIARRLSISPRTVQKHLERLFATLSVRTRTAAAARAVELLGE